MAARKVRLSVILGDGCLAAAHDDAFPAFVEYLGDAGKERFLIEAAVEAHSDIANRKLGAWTGESPWYAACFVIERRMDVPGNGRLVLNLSGVSESGLLPLL